MSERMTRQKAAILAAVMSTRTHPTADEVYELVQRRLPRVSLATVYRNLEQMAEAGEIRRLGPVSSQRRFDGDTEPHYHVRCVHCGAAEDLVIPSLDGLEGICRQHTTFQIIGHQLELLGICPACSASDDRGNVPGKAGVGQ